MGDELALLRRGEWLAVTVCRENVMQQPQGLIEVLLDVTASEADRDDAAMDLAAYDEPEVEEALIRMGADSSTPNSVAASCGEALAEIWIRKKTLNLDALKRLQGKLVMRP